jgi:hypothetical protein
MVERLHQSGRVGATYGTRRLRSVAREKRRDRRKDDAPEDETSPSAEASRTENALPENSSDEASDLSTPEATGRHIDVVI